MQAIFILAIFFKYILLKKILEKLLMFFFK